jgi:hypothetical protein
MYTPVHLKTGALTPAITSHIISATVILSGINARSVVASGWSAFANGTIGEHPYPSELVIYSPVGNQSGHNPRLPSLLFSLFLRIYY